MSYARNLDLIHIHIPKCGGTSIVHALMKVDPTVHHGHQPISHFPMRRTVPSFAVIRHPCDRFISTWKFFRSRDNFWVKKHGLPPAFGLISSMSLSNAAKSLEENQHVLDQWPFPSHVFNEVWFRQHAFVQADDMRVGNLFPFERMDLVWDWLASYGAKEVHLNAGYPSPHWSKMLDRMTVQRIERIYEKDFELYFRA